MKFKDVTDKYEKETGGERHVLSLSDNFWVSVLHRLTGFGHWEWETAICSRDPQLCQIVLGDHRKDLEGKTQNEIIDWYGLNSENRNSFDSLIEAIKGTLCDTKPTP